MEKGVLVKIVTPSGQYRDLLMEAESNKKKYEFKLIPPSITHDSDKFYVLDLLVTRLASNDVVEKYRRIINVIDGQTLYDFMANENIEFGRYFRETLGFKDFFVVAYPMHKDDKGLQISAANFGVKKMSGLVHVIDNLLQKEIKPMKNLEYNTQMYRERNGIIVPISPR